MTLPLATVATQFLDRPNLAKATAISYEIALLPFLEKYGRIHINLLDSKLVYSYLKRQSHLSSNTLNRHKVILQSLFNYAIEQGYAKTNPIGNSRRPKSYSSDNRKNRDRQQTITPRQFELLYEAVGNDCRLQLLVRLSNNTKASIRQLLALNLTDIDLETCQFTASTKDGEISLHHFSDDVTLCLKKYLRFYRHDHAEALFTAQHPVTNKVTRLSYRRVHQIWISTISSNIELANLRLQDIKNF
ncbi:MAG: tyrosine-type recombinase/integrase [Synechococcus sp.]